MPGGTSSDQRAAGLDFRGTDRYHLTSRLGTGGMGVVFRAFDRETATYVALKALHAQRPEALLRFKNEFRSLQGIRHPNLVRLGELGESGGIWFFTMELVEGVDFLSHVRARAGDPDGVPFHEGRLRQSLAQLARGLGALHAAGKIHRDVKPLNIRINEQGRVVVLDFGLVLDVDSPDRLSEGWVIGTAAYMAPEQAYADATVPASDFYAMGCVLYHALTDRAPFDGSDLDVLMRKQSELPEPPRRVVAGVPRDLDALCMDLLQCAPDNRPSELEVLRRLGDVGEPAPRRRVATSKDAAAAAFVGREREVEAIVATLHPPRRARIACVRGPSGVGKSALLQHVLQRATRDVRDSVVLSGRCYENESVPFKGVDGVVDALTSYLRALPREQAAALLPRNASLLAQVFPVLRRVEVIVESPRMRADVTDEKELRRRAFAALREMFTRIAVRAPLILAIDDVQWADPDSLALLAELVQPPEPPPLLLLVATRPRPDADPFARLPDVLRFDLDALPLDAARELALAHMRRHGVAGTAVDAETLAEEAGRHPMFLQELVAHVASVGMDRRRMVKLDDALQARFHRLSAPARRVLELACVAGAPTSQEVMALSAGLEFGAYLEAASELREANLVRTAGGRRLDLVEPYHNRIREAALRGLSDAERQEFHRLIADALEAAGEADRAPDTVLHHLTEAGQPARAAYYAERAAERARDALAFDRAVARYQLALRLGTHSDQGRTRLRLALAQTLCNAGRGAEAVDIYLAVADAAVGPARLDYQRRAMEQLLFSGHIDQGRAVVERVLGEIGDRLAKTPRRALLALAWERLKLRLRGLGWRERPEGELRPSDCARVDVYEAIGIGLSLIDNIRGADYNCRALRHALALGERKRVIRALAVEGVYLSSQHAARRARAVVAEAQRLAAEIDDPASRAYALFPQAAIHYFIENRWREALTCLGECERLFHQHVQSGGWETDTAQMYASFCMLYLGELAALGPLVQRHVGDAERRGDLYASVNLRTRIVLPWILADDPASGEQDVDAALRAWTGGRDTFQVQHFFELHSRCELALYAGDAPRAASIMARGLPGLTRSMMTRLPIVAGEVLYLRGRIAVARAAATRAGTDRATWLADARRFARRLRKLPIPVAPALGELVLAGVAQVEDDVDAAVPRLRAAIERLEDHETMLYVMPARRRLGECLGGDEGDELVAVADAWLEEQGARRPEAVAAALVPG